MVAEVIEAEFIVGAIDDVRLISLLAGGIIHIVLNRPDRQPKHPVERAHPLRVTSGQIVIHGDDVNAPTGQGIQVGGQRRHEASCLRRSPSRRFSLRARRSHR